MEGRDRAELGHRTPRAHQRPHHQQRGRPAGAPVAFFNRISLVDANGHHRLLPVFYSDNYVSILPGEQKTVTIDYDAARIKAKPVVSVSGWNLKEQIVEVK